MGAPYLQQWLWMLWMFLFFFPHCQEDFTLKDWHVVAGSTLWNQTMEVIQMTSRRWYDTCWMTLSLRHGVPWWFRKRSDLCWAPCAKRFKPGFRMRTWSELVPNTLTTSFRYQYQVSTGSVAFFFGWRYLISVVPWWGEKTRSCILWCTLTVKFGVFRGRHTVGRLQVTKCKYHLTFSWHPTTHIVQNKRKICKLYPHWKSYTSFTLQIFTVAWDVVSENLWGLPSTAGQTDLARSCGEAGLWGGSSFRYVPLWGWQDIGVPHWLNQPQIPWSTCKGSNMKCQCQSFSTPSSMKPGTSGD